MVQKWPAGAVFFHQREQGRQYLFEKKIAMGGLNLSDHWKFSWGIVDSEQVFDQWAQRWAADSVHPFGQLNFDQQ
jgi:hypothetical protein